MPCFNSRTREGCDRGVLLASVVDAGFNSRTREGCDTHATDTPKTSRMFQFTHPGGVRQDTFLVSVRDFGFNSRTREGCDLCFRT